MNYYVMPGNGEDKAVISAHLARTLEIPGMMDLIIAAYFVPERSRSKRIDAAIDILSNRKAPAGAATPTRA